MNNDDDELGIRIRVVAEYILHVLWQVSMITAYM